MDTSPYGKYALISEVADSSPGIEPKAWKFGVVMCILCLSTVDAKLVININNHYVLCYNKYYTVLIQFMEMFISRLSIGIYLS